MFSPYLCQRQILIGLEQSCPDAFKHFEAFPSYTINLFARDSQPSILTLSPKDDTRAFVRKAYQRYLHRKHGQIDRWNRPFSINDQGIAQKEFAAWSSGQGSVSPIYDAFQNCTLTNLKTSESIMLPWQLCRDFGVFNFPWTSSEIGSEDWRQSVNHSFFGSDGDWSPTSFRTPVEYLDIHQIRNRIAILGESIGWVPDFDGEIEDSEEVVAFGQEIEATCFFCYDQKPIWQMCILHCQHASCIDCVKRNYKMCLRDTSCLPPTCCKKYPLIYTGIAVGSLKDIDKLSRWIVTGSNPSPLGRCYNCSEDIWPGAECGDIGICVHCDERTCLKCQVKWHGFRRVECRLGKLSDFVVMAIVNKWAQCYRCGLVVERSEGCAHITCRCGANFCYHCGGRWPKCPCRTTGGKGVLSVKRDQAVVDGGETYTKRVSARHHSSAVRNEQKFIEVADVLKLLRVMKTYQRNVVREIRDLRKRLRLLKENGSH
ncbi:hypothetical protein TWF730_005889 [Orbilia blumenaviensis]|uniref:RING-type domain-containing protein n=1 Tax=Orbilia blumenaviensis TaxID=1796055 RepID=A0AAV9VK25_9PEZI